ncbi:MAG: cytochrome c1 [Alphaproteobacteria bacterium]
MKRTATLFFSVIFAASAALASSDNQKYPKQVHWSFDGMLGKVDKQSAQRGFQVYKEVCAACHGLERVAFRNLHDLGFTEAEIKALAAESTIADGPNDEGEMFDRAGLPSDYFPSPYANVNAARAANNGAYPPDLSLIVKARPNGANYLYSLMSGYGEPPADHHVPDGMYYNPYFAGGNIAMPAPLSDDRVVYEDGTSATTDQMSRDVVNFLQWAAEPEMEERKQMGIKVLIYLAITTIFLYIAMRHIWKRVH